VRLATCGAMLLFHAGLASAQDLPWIRTSTRFAVGMEHYSLAPSLSTTAIPQTQYRATLNSTITLFDEVVIPLEAYVTSGQVGFQQPFNQFGVSPRIGSWLRLHGGHFSMRLSELTYGDTRLLGGGIEITPEKFNFKFFHGRSRNPLVGVSVFQPTAYERTATGGTFGFRFGPQSSVDLNIVTSIDDVTSVVRDSTAPPATENTTASIVVAIPFEGVRWRTEIAAAVTTTDVTALQAEGVRSPIEELFALNSSSHFDGAVVSSLDIDAADWLNIRGDARYVGPGFVTHGFEQMPNDVIDLTIAPSVRLPDYGIFLRGSIGQRTNNLRNTRVSPTDRLIGSAMVNWRVSELFTFDAQFSNYGIRTRIDQQGAVNSNVSNSYTVTPSFMFTTGDLQHMASLTASVTTSEDISTFNPEPILNTVMVLGLSHALTLPQAVTLMTAINVNTIQNPIGSTSILSITETGNVPLFDRAVFLSGTVGTTTASTPDTPAITTLMGRLGLTYTIESYGAFTLAILGNSGMPSYPGGPPATAGTYQGSAQYSVSF